MVAACGSETQAYVRIVTGRRVEEWRPQGTLATLNVTVPADMPCDKIAAKPPAPTKQVPDKNLPWGVQLVGDRSEVKALAAYRALQKKHEAILGNHQPTIIRATAVKMSDAPIWTRIRIEAGPPPLGVNTGATQPLQKCSDGRDSIEARPWVKETDHRHCGLLRASPPDLDGAQQAQRRRDLGAELSRARGRIRRALETDCVAAHVRFEPANPPASYLIGFT